MKKKVLGLIFSAGLILSSGVALVACGGNENPVKDIYLTIGEDRGESLNLSYDYGERATIWNDLDLYAVYNDKDVS